jgi:hypothetical protein
MAQVADPWRAADVGRVPPGRVTRRAVVLAAGAGALSACSRGEDPPEPSEAREGRQRGRRKQGRKSPRGTTVLTQGDLEEVSAQLTSLLDGDDRDAFLAYARPSDPAQWERMWDGLHTVPATERRFLLQSARDGWTNPRGGPVNAVVRAVVAYRISGCDAQPMAHLCDLTVFKSPKGRVRVQTLGPLREEDAAPWLLSPVSAVSGTSVVLLSRASDAATARRVLSDVDRGAARAMRVIEPPSGVSKICVTLGWPEARDRLYGGSGAEFVGSAHNYRYVDPQRLADTGRRGRGESFEGSRVVVEPEGLAAQGAEAVTAHESVHALAFQWGRGAAPLYAEGLARWVELGAEEVTRAARRLGASSYRGFARRMAARPGRAGFYESGRLEDNYTCAAMMYVHVARRRGESAALDLARAAYDGSSDPAREVLGTSQEAQLREVADWLEDQESQKSQKSQKSGKTKKRTRSAEPDDS